MAKGGICVIEYREKGEEDEQISESAKTTRRTGKISEWNGGSVGLKGIPRDSRSVQAPLDYW